MILSDLYHELISFRERMHRKSKAVFRRYLKNAAEKLKLEYQILPQSKLAKNVIIGNLDTAEYIVGAHYDTPPKIPPFIANNIVAVNIANIIIPLVAVVLFFFFPLIASIVTGLYLLSLIYLLGFFSIANKNNQNDNTSGILVLLYLMRILSNKKVVYVFFDNEENGLIGTFLFLSYLRKQNIRLLKKQYLILDCVGRGELFRFISFQKNNIPDNLKKIAEEFKFQNYRFEVKKGSLFELSDHFVFFNYSHVGIMSYEQKGAKYKIKDIHCRKDRFLNLQNIKVITEIIGKYIDEGDCYGR